MGPVDLYHSFLLMKLNFLSKEECAFLNFKNSLLNKRTYFAFIPCTKSVYFLAHPQTPFASKCFPDACYLQQTHQHLGTRCPKDPEEQEQTCRRWGEVACKQRVSSSQHVQHQLCAGRMQRWQKHRACPPGVRGPAGQTVIQGRLIRVMVPIETGGGDPEGWPTGLEGTACPWQGGGAPFLVLALRLWSKSRRRHALPQTAALRPGSLQHLST